jgi:hypothetical protein
MSVLARQAVQGTISQWVVTALIVVLSLWLFSMKWRRDWGTHFDPKPRQGYLAEAAFVEDIATLPDECKAAESLADRGKDLYSNYLDSMKALDDKASTILGFVGGGTGIIALASGSEKMLTPPVVTPLLILSSIYLFGVLGSAIAVQLPRNRGSINVERLCDVPMMKSSSGKSKLDALIGREYVEASRKAVVVVRKKAIFLSIAQMCFAFGVASLVMNALLVTPSVVKPPQETNLRCTVSQATIDCNLKLPKEKP